MMRDRVAAFASGGTVARAAQAAGFTGATSCGLWLRRG